MDSGYMRVKVEIPENYVQILDRLVKMQRTTRSKFIREALESYLESTQKKD